MLLSRWPTTQNLHIHLAKQEKYLVNGSRHVCIIKASSVILSEMFFSRYRHLISIQMTWRYHRTSLVRMQNDVHCERRGNAKEKRTVSEWGTTEGSAKLSPTVSPVGAATARPSGQPGITLGPICTPWNSGEDGTTHRYTGDKLAHTETHASCLMHTAQKGQKCI